MSADERRVTPARQQAALAEFGVRALAGMSRDALLHDASALAAEMLNVELVKIVELLPDGMWARVVAGIGWHDGVVGQATIPLGSDSAAGFALQTHEPVIVDDLDADRRLTNPPLLREHGVVSGVSVILYGRDRQAFGVIGAHSTRRRHFDTDDVALLQGIANVVSAALQRYAVEDALHRQTEELEQQTEEAQTLAEELEVASEELHHSADRAARLLAVSTGLSAANSVQAVANVIFREGLAAIGADAGSLAIVHPPDEHTLAGAELEIVHSVGYPAPISERYRRFPLVRGRPVSDAVLTRMPRLLSSWESWIAEYPDTSRDLGGMGYEAFVAIPVVSGGRVLAALSASFRAPRRFDEPTRTFLATLGEQCGLALARAHAFESERRARDASDFLSEASRVLGASLDLETTLRTVAHASVPRLGDWCAVDLVRDPGASTWPPSLERVAIVHEDAGKVAMAEELERRYPSDWSDPAGMASVIRDRRTLYLREIPEALIEASARDAEHLAMLRSLHFSSIVVVPLVARDTVLGALTLCHTESGRHYDEADVQLAEELARRAAVAVDNARLYRDAEAARKAAEEANRAKSEFLATMSHELRTPLNAIAGHVELVTMELYGPVTEKQREALDRVTRAQRHLLGLINDVLNYARIESARLEYDVETVDLHEVMRDVKPMVEPQLRAKGLDFAVRLPDDAPASLVRADREKLVQIVLNLLSNAIKFTPSEREGMPGRVTVDVAAPSDGRVPLRVSDTGVGIPRDKLDAVFEPFVQVRSEFSRDSGGTGLGLAISRELARGMGGDLTVESEVGAGSTFVVTLPSAGRA